MLNVSQMRLRWASFSLTKTTCAHIWSRSNMKFKTLQLLPTKWWSCTKKVVFSALDFYSEWNLKNYCRIIWRAIYKLTEVFTTHLFKYKLICWLVGLSVCVLWMSWKVSKKEREAFPMAFMQLNKWRGVTILLRTGGQGHPTPIHTPTPTLTLSNKLFNMRIFPLFDLIITGQRTDGRTKPLIELLKENYL